MRQWGSSPLGTGATRCDEKVAPQEPSDSVRGLPGAANYSAGTDFRFEPASAFVDGFGGTEVVGCRAVWRWERRSPVSAQPVGQHMKDWFFVGVGE